MSLDITSGLYSQIQQLKKRLKALDAAEANPSDITEVSKALEALEARYEKQKESKRIRMEERKKKEADEFNSQVLQLMGGDEAKPETAPASTEVVAAGCDQCSASMINGVFCHETGCPNSRKRDDIDMDATTTPQAATNILALDTRVEPTRGTPGSYGRVMRHDAGSDTVYVMWDGGKLKEAHGFGAYSLADLKVHSAELPVEKKVAEPMAEPTPEDVQNMPNAQNPVAPQGPKGNPEKRYQQIKKIVDESQYGKVEGQMVDGFTASLLLQISDQLSPENRVKFLSMPMERMVDVAWKLANKSTASAEMQEMTKEAAQFSTHGNGKGLNDLYILPSTPEEGQKIAEYLKSKDQMFQWSNANVQGHEWYGKRFIEIPFGESMKPEIEQIVGGPVVASIQSAAEGEDESLMGWPNKETWATKLWIDNDRQWYLLSRSAASKATSAGELATLLQQELHKDVMEEMGRRHEEQLNYGKINWMSIAEAIWDEKDTTPAPSGPADAEEEVENLPVMDKYKIRDTINKLLEDLHKETDPAKKEQIKQRIKSLKSAGRHPNLKKFASSDQDIISIMVSEGWGADTAKMEVASWRKGDNITPGALASINQAIKQLQKRAPVAKSNEPSGVGYGGDRPGVNVAPMRDEDVSLEAGKCTTCNKDSGEYALCEKHRQEAYDNQMARGPKIKPRSSLTVFAKEFVVQKHQDKLAYDIFEGEQKLLTITPKEELTPEQVEIIVAQEYAKKNVVKAQVIKDLTVLKKGHQVRILALDEKKLHVKFASLENPELTGWAPFTKFQIEAHANPGECPTCRRSRDMKDSGDGKSKCSYCGTTSDNKDLDGNNGGKRPWDKKADLQEMKHGDHVDRILGQRDNEVLAFCGNKVVWLPKGDMTSTTPPPATPEALNPEVASMQDEVSPLYCDKCKKVYDLGQEHVCEASMGKEAGPLCANCGTRFNNIAEYTKHKEEAHKPANPEKTKEITDRVEKKLAPHLVSKRLGKKDPKYNYDEEMENAEELPEDAEASKSLPAVEKSADDVNTPPNQQAPQGMKWSWDADKRRWFLVKQQGMI